jgi:hypothetical protein
VAIDDDDRQHSTKLALALTGPQIIKEGPEDVKQNKKPERSGNRRSKRATGQGKG